MKNDDDDDDDDDDNIDDDHYHHHDARLVCARFPFSDPGLKPVKYKSRYVKIISNLF